MSARDEIFANIRRSLGVTGSEAARRTAVDDRLDRAPKGLIPKRAQLPRAEMIELFVKMADAASATVTRLDDASKVPAEIARYLRDHNLPATLRMGDDARLTSMPWGETQIETSRGRSFGQDLNAVSCAFAAVAETGTLVMTAGADNPTTLNFLPDNHVVVLHADDVVGDPETALGRVRAKFGKGAMPRVVNFITGPSRSADIEQTLLLGAHGPRRLHIVLLGA